jgi:hypothetical protein
MKLFPFVLVVMSMLVSSASAERIEWRKEAVVGSHSFTEQYQWENCTVMPFGDGSGIHIIAYEPIIQKTYFLDLFKTEHGTREETHSNVGPREAFQDQLNECLQALEYLPEKVKRTYR